MEEDNGQGLHIGTVTLFYFSTGQLQGLPSGLARHCDFDLFVITFKSNCAQAVCILGCLAALVVKFSKTRYLDHLYCFSVSLWYT